VDAYKLVGVGIIGAYLLVAMCLLSLIGAMPIHEIASDYTVEYCRKFTLIERLVRRCSFPDQLRYLVKRIINEASANGQILPNAQHKTARRRIMAFHEEIEGLRQEVVAFG
jgi:hypothetical protein